MDKRQTFNFALKTQKESKDINNLASETYNV